MTDAKRIEKLEKENEIMKKILIYFVTRVDHRGQIKDFSSKDAITLEELLRQLIM